MKDLIKKLIPYLPKSVNIFLYRTYEKVGEIKVKKHYSYKNIKKENKKIKNILFYHPSGLSFGGTEKFLQIIAKHIDSNKYNLSYMYSSKPRYNNQKADGRKYYLENENIELIHFNYKNIQNRYPYIIEEMNPDIFNVIKEKNTDLLIVPGSGYSEFPFNIINDIPIIMLNIFGSPSSQKNIINHVCISNEVEQKISHVVSQRKRSVVYIPSEKPSDESYKATQIRERFGIKENDFVFGRIGRASNEIFDPIGINAFKEVVKKYPTSHYLIMSTPPIIKEIVEKENIPNVHFIEASSDETDVWAFHQSIDVLAHFRMDGESCGLNIIESMLCGNPIITHKSHIWNAHLEYLKPEFSRVTEKDDVEQYAVYMEEMIKMKESGKMKDIRENLKKYAEEMFLIENNIGKIEKIIEDYNAKN